jgi:tetratricopeptide (TPR) repeat protein
MARERLKIFVSAVTSEFGKARDALAADLRACGHEVTVQSDFKLSPDSETLLGRLAEYIRDCHAVICIVGKQCGACPPTGAAGRFPDVLPKAIKDASYTQWEFFLARHYKRRPYLYIARADYVPDKLPSASDRADLQNAYGDFLKADGAHYGPFSNVDQLARAVFKDLPELAAKPEGKPKPVAKPIVLPYPSIGDLFKGRDEFMARLRESVTRTRGARTAIVSQALYGLGGIGKTRVAVEYAWTNANEYSALLFVVAETPEALRRNVAALSTTLLPRLDTTDDAVKLTAVLDWLRTNPGWLLILDNVDSKPALAEVEHLLSGLSGGQVIVTSRLADFSGHFQPLELNVLAIDDAAAFLLERTKDRRRVTPDDETRAREVADELGGLALALEQAAAFISKRRLTFTQYLEEWRSKRDEVLAWFDATVTDYPRAVAVTWQTSVAQLTDGGRRLLERLAWLAPEKVPESLLDVPVRGAEGEDLHGAYEDLAAYSLVSRDAEGPFFLVHRLVQDVTRRSLAGELPQRSLIEALAWIDGAFVGAADDVRNWPTLEPLVSHGRAATTHAHKADITESTSRLMNNLALLLNAKALHAEAEPLMRRTLAIDEKSFGPDHREVATDLNNLAQLLRATNRLSEAEPLMRRALAIGEKSSGSDHSGVATYLSNLAVLLQDTNRCAEAEPLMRRALAIDEKSFGPDHPTAAIRLNNLAELLRATNRLAEAEPLYRRVLDIFEKVERDTRHMHPNFSGALNNLALMLQTTNRHAEAEPLFRRALAIDEKSFGPGHPKVAIRLNNLAVLLKDTNRLGEAEPLMRRVISIFENNFGPDHPSVATALSNLAGLLQATNRLAEAEPLYYLALAIDEKSFGPDHPEVATDLNNLALLLQVSDRLADAEPLMQRALAIFVEFTRRTGHRHPHLDAMIRNYRDLLKAMGKSQAEIDSACAELMRPLAGTSSAPARNAGEADHPERA